MGLAAVFYRFPVVVDKTPSRDVGNRWGMSAWSLFASIGFHCVALACVIGWTGKPAEMSSVLAVEAALVAESVPVSTETLHPEASPSNPPSTKTQEVAAAHRMLVRTARPKEASSHAQSPLPMSSAIDRSDEPSGTSVVGVQNARSGSDDTIEENMPQGRAFDTAATPMGGNPAPIYPMSARHAGREGQAILLVMVTPTGECADVKVDETSGTPSLDEAALVAVRRWRFNPATRAGHTFETTLRVPITFKLTDVSS
jgi:protein TonB